MKIEHEKKESYHGSAGSRFLESFLEATFHSARWKGGREKGARARAGVRVRV